MKTFKEIYGLKSNPLIAQGYGFAIASFLLILFGGDQGDLFYAMISIVTPAIFFYMHISGNTKQRMMILFTSVLTFALFWSLAIYLAFFLKIYLIIAWFLFLSPFAAWYGLYNYVLPFLKREKAVVNSQTSNVLDSPEVFE